MALEGDKVFTPSIKGKKAKEIPSCPCSNYDCVTTREKNDSEVNVDSKRVKAEVDFD